eukprot:GGOE01058599.1.p1 GENE.GGOE01058599.1~~GGOE01058599.1.p1  ORF type:complete len:402 (+),score=145.22 GGOE01058599.1:61-1266(+)
MLDPFEELRIPVMQGKAVTEVHFSGRGVTALHPNFQKLVNLETLWLANNKISKIDNLVPENYGDSSGDIADRVHGVGCLRIRSLYLSNNRITTLVGDLKHLRFLQVLLLAHNKLSNMEFTSTFLKPLQFLQQLDLFGNPMAEEQNYREYMVHHHPSVTLLDRKSVTAEEREAASRLFGGATKRGPMVAFGKGVPAEVLEFKCPRVPLMSESVQQLERKVIHIRAREEAAVQRAREAELEMARQQREERSRMSAPQADNHTLIELAIHRRSDEEARVKRIGERDRLRKLLFTPSELQALQSSFAPTKALEYSDVLSALKLLRHDEPAARRELRDLVGAGQPLTVSHFLDHLMDSPAFLQNQLDTMFSGTQAALGQGREKEAQQLHSDINFVTGHLQSLQAAH